MPNPYSAGIESALASGRLSRPLSTTSVANLPREEQNQIIADQINSRLGEAEGGPSIWGRGMNIFGRVMDLASRPLYSVAETVQSGIEGENPLQGTWEGFSGQEKTTFSDVLESAGVENKLLRGVGGFALDIALDPLTYAGAGIVRRVADPIAEVAGAKAANALMRSGSKQGEIIRTAAEKEFIREAEGKVVLDFAPDLVRKKTLTAADKVGEQAVQDAAYNRHIFVRNKKLAGKEIRDAGKFTGKIDKPRVQFKYMGKEIAGSPRLYEFGEKLAKRTRETTLGRALNTAFRPAANYPAGLNELKRRNEAMGIQWSENAQHQVNDLMKPLKGKDTDTKTLFNTVTSGNAHLLEGDMSRMALQGKMMSDQLFELEKGLHLRSADEYVDNYWYAVFDSKDDPVAVKRFRELNKKDIRRQITANKKRVADGKAPKSVIQHYDPAKAKEMLLHPVEDYGISLKNQIVDFSNRMTNAKLLDDTATNFGVRLPKKYAERANIAWEQASPDRVKGYYFPKEVARAISKNNYLHTDEAAGAGLLKLYDQVLSGTKFLQTVANLGHHIRNMIGDMNLNALDGLTTYQPYEDGLHVLTHADRYNPELAFLTPELAEQAIKPSTKTFQFGSRTLTPAGVYQAYVESGAKAGYTTSEFGTSGVFARVRRASEFREDYARMAHFIDALGKEVPQTGKISPVAWSDAVKRAGQRVRKFNLDYGDLTPFEKRVMKRVIPYYTWLRKNAPLQAELLVMKPGKQMVIPKALENLQTVLGTEEEPTLDGIPIIPGWMKDAMSTRIGGSTMFNPSIFPLYTLNDVLSNESVGNAVGIPNPKQIARQQISQMSLPIQIPIEQATGIDLFTNRGVNESNLSYAAGSVPYTRLVDRILSGKNIMYPIINELVGPGFGKLEPSYVGGELRTKQDILNRVLREQRRATEG